ILSLAWAAPLLHPLAPMSGSCAMNAVFSPRFVGSLVLVLVGIALFTSTAVAGPAIGGMSTSPILQANFIWEFASDRTRLIHVSLVVVTLGCAIMWWYR